MSEKILNTLMHLFAIIARPAADSNERRLVVSAFLETILSLDLVEEYLKTYDNYFTSYQQKQTETSRQYKNIALSSVKILKICYEINLELSFQQKRIVLFRLIQFIKTGKDVSKQELEFVQTVANAFLIEDEEYNRIKNFILPDFDKIPDSDQQLVINAEEKGKDNRKHIQRSMLKGQLCIFNMETTSLFILRYKGSDEIYLNGQLILQDNVYVLSFGASIRNSRMKPVFYSDITSAFYTHEIQDLITIEIENATYKFPSGKVGIQSINFAEQSGNLIGVMGSSGSGKTTLLNMLNGMTKPASGSIKINGIDIYEHPEKVEGLIGYVSQDDLLIEELTVFQNLYFNSELCFGNMNKVRLARKVLKVLLDLGLYEIKDMVVGSPLNKKISGGQRKRLNIALELIREPAILFLDEPTSGLSSRDSENILMLLKDLTLKGKLIFTVIHQPSSDIFKMFDKLLLLDTGGYLIYYGNPVDSIIYFKTRSQKADWNDSECRTCGNVNSEQLFNIVEASVVDEYGNLTKIRKIPPQEWYAQYLREEQNENKKQKKYNKIPKVEFKPPSKFKQFSIFVKRDVLSKLANVQYLIINFFEAPVLAFMLAYIIKFFNVDATNEKGYILFENSNLPVYIFMSVIVAIFIGLTVSAEEIIKDRKTLNRERFLNLSWSSYLFSKIVILMIISAFQAFAFVLIGNIIMEVKGMFFNYWISLFSAWVGANLMGLIISDSFKTVVTIYILIPFLVIPQLILSGIIVPYDKLNPNISSPTSIPWYGEIITARWAYEALAVYQYTENEYEKNIYQCDRILSNSTYRKDYWIKSLENKLDFIEHYKNDTSQQTAVAVALSLIKAEMSKELLHSGKPKIEGLENLSISTFSDSVRDNIEDYLADLTIYYINLYNRTNNLKDEIIQNMEDSLGNGFLEMKEKSTNRSLTEFVRNSNSLDRIIEYKNRLYQKIDPVYQNPEGKFIKSHFYAPFKPIFKYYFSTFWVNMCVIWFINIVLFFVLKYRALFLLFSLAEKIDEKIRKKKYNT